MFIFTEGDRPYTVYIHRRSDAFLCLYSLKERDAILFLHIYSLKEKGHSMILFTKGERPFHVYIN